jgi:outer membrane cobalamin receptor
MNYSKYFFLIPAVLSFNLFAQDAANSSDVEEIVVVGSQIKGAKITGSLPVSIITSEDIEALGIESGEELVANIAENGGNNFNQTDFNGGYNANRGDVGALDLRNWYW